MAKKKVEKKKKLEKAERKKLQKLVGEMMMPMFEKYQGEVRIYATKNGVIITPSENDADYPEMPESLALTGISKFLGIKNTIEVAQVSIDDKKLWVSRSLCPHLYVKTEEKTSDEKVDVDFSHIGEDPIWDDTEFCQDNVDDFDGEEPDNALPLCDELTYAFYEIIAEEVPGDRIFPIIDFILGYINTNGERTGIKKLTSLLSVDNARIVRIIRRDKRVDSIHYSDVKYLFINLLKVLMNNNPVLFSKVSHAYELYFADSERLNLVASNDIEASVTHAEIRSMMTEKHGYPFHESQCYKLLTRCINRSSFPYPADKDRFFPRLIKILQMYGDTSELTDEYELKEENRAELKNTFEKILRGFKKCEYYDEIIEVFSDYIKEYGDLHLLSPDTNPWAVIKEKDFNAMVGRINNEGEKS